MPVTVFPQAAPHPLPATTHLGTVHLSVADLGRQVDFYTGLIGLQLLSRSAAEARLGAGGRELLRLTLKPGARHYERMAGLYHFCLLLPSRRDFGLLLRRLVASKTPLQGLVDHHAAEAIYLPDPEGNGIELNWDRDRSAWAGGMQEVMRHGNGPLDVEGLLALADAAPTDPGRLPDDATVGHLHLHVADLAAARAFYHDLLGLDLTGEFPRQAVFTSAGGYHHHIAFNVWHGLGAPEPPADASGLVWASLVVGDGAALEALLGRLREAGIPLSPGEGGWLLKDPAGNSLLLAA